MSRCRYQCGGGGYRKANKLVRPMFYNSKLRGAGVGYAERALICMLVKIVSRDPLIRASSSRRGS